MFWSLSYTQFRNLKPKRYIYMYMYSLHPSTSVYLSYHIYQEGALSLQAVSMQSAGQYTCHASNSEGNVTRVTKVKIKGQLLPDSLSVCLPASSFSLCDVCVPDWLGATVIYISVSPSCIIWKSGNRNSNWIKLSIYPCEDNNDIMIWDKISCGNFAHHFIVIKLHVLLNLKAAFQGSDSFWSIVD